MFGEGTLSVESCVSLVELSLPVASGAVTSFADDEASLVLEVVLEVLEVVLEGILRNPDGLGLDAVGSTVAVGFVGFSFALGVLWVKLVGLDMAALLLG